MKLAQRHWLNNTLALTLDPSPNNNNNNNTIYIAHQQPVKKIPKIRYQ